MRPDHLKLLATLPMHHRDPFDHLLIAQAITEDAAFITADWQAARYSVRAIACD
jgi:PIN domain nuclease of toxin-antitoxin system